MSTNAHQVDQPVCIDGMAAYWFDTSATAPVSNDQQPAVVGEGVDDAVAVAVLDLLPWQAPYCDVSPSSRGGISEKDGEADQRQRGHGREGVAPDAGSGRAGGGTATISAHGVTMKWAVP